MILFTPDQWNAVQKILVREGFLFKEICAIPLFPDLAQQFVAGKYTEQEFIEDCNKMNIVNGGRLKI